MWITLIASAVAASIWLGLANLAIQLDKGKAAPNAPAKVQLGRLISAPPAIGRS